jgi:hypothetical protein
MRISKKDFKELCQLLNDHGKLLKEQQKIMKKLLNKKEIDLSISDILKEIYISSIKGNKL